MPRSERSLIRCSHGCIASSSERVKRRTRLAIPTCFAVLALAFANGCTRAVLVSESSPIRTGPDMRGRVYVRSADGWQLSENAVTIPEGWYCVPPSYVESDTK